MFTGEADDQASGAGTLTPQQLCQLFPSDFLQFHFYYLHQQGHVTASVCLLAKKKHAFITFISQSRPSDRLCSCPGHQACPHVLITSLSLSNIHPSTSASSPLENLCITTEHLLVQPLEQNHHLPLQLLASGSPYCLVSLQCVPTFLLCTLSTCMFTLV